MAYKINFKDSNCQYVEDYNAGKYGTKVKIYFCEGDGCCPKQYSGSVGTEMITADTIDELKLKLDRAVANRDKEIAKTLTDSKVKDSYDNLDTYTIQKAISYINLIAKNSYRPIDKILEDLRWNFPSLTVENVKEMYESVMGTRLDSSIIKKAGFKDSKKVKDGDYPLNYYLEDLAMDSVISNDIINDFDYFKEICSEEGYDVKERDYKYYSDLCKDYNKSLKECREDLVEIAKSEGGNTVTDKVLKLWANNWKDLDTLIKAEAYYRATNNRLSKLESEVIFKDGKDFRDSYGEWDYEINCEGNQWADGGFDSEEEAEDEAIAKVNELLSRHFPEDYAIDDFDITIMNTETGETYLYDPYTDIRDCNMATLTPGTVKLKRASKKFNQRDAKFKDASAEEIIDLFHEAYIKGRTWDWLKSKLPSTFLNLKNRRWEEIFPIQADRTGKLRGVNLTKPKNLSEEYVEKVDELLEVFEEYMRQVEHLEDYGVRVDTYNYDTLSKEIQDTIDSTDSKKQSVELEHAYDYLRNAWKKVRDKSYYIPGISIWSDVQTLADLLNKGSYEEFKNYIYNQINDNYRNKDYKEEQRKPIIYNNKGSFIRSDSKVGPLTPEAEAYIRKVMGGTTTEEIESKKKLRGERRNGDYDWYAGKGGIKEFGKEIYDIKQLLSELKREKAKEKRMDISVSNRKHGYYKYTGNGNIDYNGSYRKNGGYEYTPETKPTTVSIDVQGLNDLQYALAKILNSGTVAEVEENLQEALDIVKKLPRNNPKVAEIKAKIKALLEKRANTPVTRRPLPDKKFVRDSLRKGLKDGLNSKELAEYIDLCKKLKLNTLADIEKFSKEHSNAKDQDLLEALRKEAKKLK